MIQHKEDERCLKRRIIISEPRTAWLSRTVVKKVGLDAVKADVVARIYADSFNSNPLQTAQQKRTCQNAKGERSRCKFNNYVALHPMGVGSGPLGGHPPSVKRNKAHAN